MKLYIEEYLTKPIEERLFLLSQSSNNKKIIDILIKDSKEIDFNIWWEKCYLKIMFNLLNIPGIYSSIEDDLWFGIFLSKINIIIDIDLEATASSSYSNDNYVITVNPFLFLCFLNIQEQIAILKHEVSHIINKHFIRFNSTLEFESTNIALDIAINQHIDNIPTNYTYNGKVYIHPLRGVFPDDFKLKKNKSAENYNLKLIKKREKSKSLTLREALTKASNIKEKELSLSKHNKLATKITKEKIERMEGKLLELISQVKNELKEMKKQLKGRDIIPASLEKDIDINNGIEKNIPWEKTLKKYIGKKLSKRKRDTFMKRHLIFPDEPQIPGRIRNISKPEVYIILDTSGSMSDSDIDLALNEIRSISKELKLIVKVLQVDTNIVSVTNISDKTSRIKRKGFGGTYMYSGVNAILNRSQEFKLERLKFKIKKPDLIIIITDGMIEKNWPIRYNYPIIWLTTMDILSFNYSSYSKHNHIKMTNKKFKGIIW